MHCPGYKARCCALSHRAPANFNPFTVSHSLCPIQLVLRRCRTLRCINLVGTAVARCVMAAAVLVS